MPQSRREYRVIVEDGSRIIVEDLLPKYTITKILNLDSVIQREKVIAYAIAECILKLNQGIIYEHSEVSK